MNDTTPDFVFIDDASRPYLVSKGWLWRRHPDGQWVSLRELKEGEIGELERRKLTPALAKPTTGDKYPRCKSDHVV